MSEKPPFNLREVPVSDEDFPLQPGDLVRLRRGVGNEEVQGAMKEGYPENVYRVFAIEEEKGDPVFRRLWIGTLEADPARVRDFSPQDAETGGPLAGKVFLAQLRFFERAPN